MRRPQGQLPPVRYEQILCRGGLDLITPTLSLGEGFLRDSINFECNVAGGYTRIAGYERLDGQAKPSDATYTTLQITAFVNTPTTGQTLTGGTSGATGTIVWVGSNYVCVTKQTGTYQIGENLSVGATLIGVNTTLTTYIDPETDAQITAASADVYRALITVVPGSGPVRGVFIFGGIYYAFRDNAGGTAVDLYKSSSSGWVNVPFVYEVAFNTGGTAVPTAGQTLTKGGVTATIKAVVRSSGSFAANTAAGYLVISAPSGGNFSAGAATAGTTNVTLAGIQTAITLTPGGKFETDEGNFYGTSATNRVYGCDGVNKGFEFDGTTLVPIRTGATNDTPKHVKIHKGHLFWAIRSSVVHSAPGDPYDYQAAAFAGEIAVGDEVTALLIQPGAQTTAALGVICRSNINILYGTGSSDWNMAAYNQGVGAIHYSGQNMSQSYFFDDRGVTNLTTTLNYGNFTQATLTTNIKPFIVEKRSMVSCSTVNREKSQYRVFFDDGYALYVTIVNGQYLGSMPVNTPMIAYCAFEGESGSGDEVTLVGATNGYVYEFDKGTSFDGASIDASMLFNWNFCGSPRVLKRFRKASVEMQGNYYAQIGFGYQLGYGTTEIDQPTGVYYDSTFSGVPRWDAFTWDSFVWDGRTLAPTECEVMGTAENIQFAISTTTNYIAPFTTNSIVFHFTPRRGIR